MKPLFPHQPATEKHPSPRANLVESAVHAMNISESSAAMLVNHCEGNNGCTVLEAEQGRVRRNVEP